MALEGINLEVLQAYGLKTIGMFVWLAVGIGILAGVWYWLFVLKRRRKWHITIEELKSDGRLHTVGKDQIYQKRINKGKQFIFILKHRKVEVIPPNWECTERIGNKEFARYIRIENEYIPAQVALSQKTQYSINQPIQRKRIFDLVKRHLLRIKTMPAHRAEQEYIYVPLHKAVKFEEEFKPIPYDMNMMRINSIDNMEKMFAQRQDWLQRYMPVIIIGLGIVMVIVVAYLSYEYMQKVISQDLAAAHEVASPITNFLSRIGGGAPPS